MSVAHPKPAEPVPAANSPRTEAIRQTAAQLFEASGYSATTMNDIADAVGLRPGSLYHHFASKEDIAVELLDSFSQSLEELGRTALLRPHPAADPQAAIRTLSAEVATLSFKHAGAVRLRAFGSPPSVSTRRLTRAMALPAPALDRAWQRVWDSLPAIGPNASLDLGLLRFALQRLTLSAPVYYPSTMAPEDVASQLCEALFGGMVIDCPDDGELDRSAASRAAAHAVSAWRGRDRRPATSDRDQIVAAARAEFARRGYEATTIRDIAGAASVRVATLYRRVESKETLLAEIIDEYGSSFDQAFRAVVAAGGTAPELLDGLARVLVSVSRLFAGETRIVSYGWSQRESASSPLHDYYIATQGRLAELAKVVQSGLDAATVRPIAPAATMALHFRTVAWLPLHDHGRTSEANARSFLRQSLLRGALSGQ
jgi:AcrR family transcriptional regulator